MKLALKTIVYFCLLITTCNTLISKNKVSLNTTNNVKTLNNSIVFIAGFDKDDNQYYNNARSYFKQKKFKIIEDTYSLEAIINWLNKNENETFFYEIHIVSHSNPWRGMSLKTLENGERITIETLQEVLKNKSLPKLHKKRIENANIIFHSCGLGENKKLLQVLKSAFSNDKTPNIIASPHFNVFDGSYNNHYLAKPFYVFYPTSKSPGKTDLSKEIAKKYPTEKQINWLKSLNKKQESYVGEPYSYQFNIPVKWEFDFTNSSEKTPTFSNDDEIMDWIIDKEEISKELLKLNIPIEKYRWNYKVTNNKLIILGKTTVICVLKPLITTKKSVKHSLTDINNTDLYIKI
ncbi:hypothetical protein [Polaribacter sargassicola]|uniref:hypothetical protein n=1 Tax=Polaribacter sargassicola TaxID=2836891 RepID=UPI001F457F61|nr:hypothetical protein [Polaribacter sp. DS7-9]MCG1036899.1 hypothetical protein [Polaribacter sp. DS7-9]